MSDDLTPSVYVVWWTTHQGVTLSETGFKDEKETFDKITELISLGYSEIQWVKLDPQKGQLIEAGV